MGVLPGREAPTQFTTSGLVRASLTLVRRSRPQAGMDLNAPEIYGLVDRLRRQFPRNMDVLAITDVVVNLLAGRIAPAAAPANAQVYEKPTTSRRDYMRNYMRERRAKQRQSHDQEAKSQE